MSAFYKTPLIAYKILDNDNTKTNNDNGYIGKNNTYTSTSYSFGTDSDFNVVGEQLQFFKILNLGQTTDSDSPDSLYSDPKYDDIRHTVQKFYYNINTDNNDTEHSLSVDMIINKDSIQHLKENYYVKQNYNKNDLPALDVVNKKYDFYTALNTIQKLATGSFEVNSYKKQTELAPSSQDFFFQVYNDRAAMNNTDNSVDAKPFCEKIFRSIPKRTSDKYISINSDIKSGNHYIFKFDKMRSVFYYKLTNELTDNDDKKLSCWIECRNINIPCKTVFIDNNTFMCMIPEFLLAYINPNIYRKLIFNLEGNILDCDNHVIYKNTYANKLTNTILLNCNHDDYASWVEYKNLDSIGRYNKDSTSMNEATYLIGWTDDLNYLKIYSSPSAAPEESVSEEEITQLNLN